MTQQSGAPDLVGDRRIRHLFIGLIRAAVDEIVGRLPTYFNTFEVSIPKLDQVCQTFRLLPPFKEVSYSTLATAIVRGTQVLEDFGIPLQFDSDQSDPISMVLLESIADAYLAAAGIVPLLPPPAVKPSVDAFLSNGYSLERTRAGVSYVLRRGNGQPLVIISATGVPFSIWSHLLSDECFDRRFIAVESRAGSLLKGGTENRSTLLQDAEDIHSVLLAENLGRADIVAWCNGGRTAIELAGRAPDRIASLTLVAPTFHGSFDALEYPSPFEDSLQTVYEALMNDPSLGQHLLNHLSKSHRKNVRMGQSRRVEAGDAVLRLAPHAFTKELLLPLSNAEHFCNYMQRVTTDDAYDVRAAVQKIQCRVLLINGTHDAATNTQAARDVLMRSGRRVLHSTVNGAGHHSHVLQYVYFKYVLQCFLSHVEPARTARLNVDWLTDGTGDHSTSSVPLQH